MTASSAVKPGTLFGSRSTGTGWMKRRWRGAGREKKRGGGAAADRRGRPPLLGGRWLDRGLGSHCVVAGPGGGCARRCRSNLSRPRPNIVGHRGRFHGLAHRALRLGWHPTNRWIDYLNHGRGWRGGVRHRDALAHKVVVQRGAGRTVAAEPLRQVREGDEGFFRGIQNRII